MADHKFTMRPSLNCYNRGCRCSECKALRNTYLKQWRIRKRSASYKRTNRGQRSPFRSEEEKRAHSLEYFRIYRRKYRKTPKGRAIHKASNKRYRQRNPDKFREAVRKSRRQNSSTARGRLSDLLKKARRRGAAGQCTPDQLSARWGYFAGLCYLCGCKADTIDHVIPISRGGSNWPANLRPACRSCNSRKHNHSLSEFLLLRDAA